MVAQVLCDVLGKIFSALRFLRCNDSPLIKEIRINLLSYAAGYLPGQLEPLGLCCWRKDSM